MSRGWQRILAVLGVCLPIPLLAVTGLSIPLPAPVERIAAALVPWADAATLAADQALAPGAHGSIVLLAGEGIAGEAGEPHATSAARSERLSLGDVGGPGGGEEGGGGEGGGGGASKTKEEDTGSSGGSQDPVKTDPGGKEPTEDSTVLEDSVKTVEDTTDGVVGSGNGVLDDVGGAIDKTGATLDETLAGLGH